MSCEMHLLLKQLAYSGPSRTLVPTTWRSCSGRLGKTQGDKGHPPKDVAIFPGQQSITCTYVYLLVCFFPKMPNVIDAALSTLCTAARYQQQPRDLQPRDSRCSGYRMQLILLCMQPMVQPNQSVTLSCPAACPACRLTGVAAIGTVIQAWASGPLYPDIAPALSKINNAGIKARHRRTVPEAASPLSYS